jgi:hypothetical protein
MRVLCWWSILHEVMYLVCKLRWGDEYYMNGVRYSDSCKEDWQVTWQQDQPRSCMCQVSEDSVVVYTCAIMMWVCSCPATCMCVVWWCNCWGCWVFEVLPWWWVCVIEWCDGPEGVASKPVEFQWRLQWWPRVKLTKESSSWAILSDLWVYIWEKKSVKYDFCNKRKETIKFLKWARWLPLRYTTSSPNLLSVPRQFRQKFPRQVAVELAVLGCPDVV